MKHNTLFHNLKLARPAFLAALMLITFAAAVIPAASQSSPPAAQTSPPLISVPVAEVQAVPVGVGRGVGPGLMPPASNNGYCTYRIHGWYYLYGNWGVINNNSTVLEAISEYSPYPWDRFIGSASMQIYNIAPYNGGVEALVFVNWGSDLNVRLDVLTTN